jgi:hypothetical protein
MDVDVPEGAEAAFMGTPQLSTASTATSGGTQSTVSVRGGVSPESDHVAVQHIPADP